MIGLQLSFCDSVSAAQVRSVDSLHEGRIERHERRHLLLVMPVMPSLPQPGRSCPETSSTAPIPSIGVRNVRTRPAFSGWPRTEQSTNVTGPQKKRFLQIAADGTGIRPDPITPPLLTEKREALETEPKKEGSGNVIKSQSSQRPEQP